MGDHSQPTAIPRSDDEHVDLPWLPSATCPHCAGLPARSCHVCDGYRVIGDMAKLRDAARYVWARPGCRCDACRILGRARAASTAE